jgi:hypothetical protein
VQRDPRKEKSNADPVRNLQAHAHMFIEFGLSLLVVCNCVVFTLMSNSLSPIS